MSVRTGTIRPATSKEWDSICGRCVYATYFHSREWAEIWHAYDASRFAPSPLMLEFSDGKSALLPFSKTVEAGGLMTRYISSPAGTFGGWISGDTLTREHALLIRDFLLHRLDALVWRVNPYDPLIAELDLRVSREDETSALRLDDGIEGLYRRWSKGHQGAVRQAMKSGVTVETASELKHWEAYFAIYKDSLRRWGSKATSRYDWRLFEEFCNRRSEAVRLWLAYHGGTAIAGALCFYEKRHVVYWHGAALETAFNLRPAHLLMYHCIRDACERGCDWFDFNPSGGHEGVKTFKTRFGSAVLRAPLVTIASRRARVLRALARVAGRK